MTIMQLSTLMIVILTTKRKVSKKKKKDIIRQTIEYKITMVNLEKVLLQRIGSIKSSTIEDTEFMNVHVTSKAKSKEYCRTP